jgi:hypothetical protein
MTTVLYAASATFAFAAAWLWLKAADVRTPTMNSYGKVQPPNLAFIQQNSLSAWAARAAAVAALLQGSAAFIGPLRRLLAWLNLG